MVTILEILQNANYNLQESKVLVQIDVARIQLKNAVVLLEKGYSINEDVEHLITDGSNIEDAPEKSENEGQG